MPESQPTVAIVGASADRSKFGNKAVRAHLASGYRVFPIHPKADEIEGLTAYASLADLPVETLDRVSFYVPPTVGITLLEAVKAISPQEFYLNPGTESRELLEAAASLGLTSIRGCSIVDLGLSPADFDA